MPVWLSPMLLWAGCREALGLPASCAQAGVKVKVRLMKDTRLLCGVVV